MNANELLNPNLHLTFTVKLDCDNKVWRRNASDNADGAEDVLQDDLQDALRYAVEGVLRSELGKDSTAFADYSCEVVDDDKTPIYAYNWEEPPLSMLRSELACAPMRNGYELAYVLRSWYVLEREAVTDREPDYCHPEEGHFSWRIEDENGIEIDSGEGDEEACQRRFEEIMAEETK